MPDTKNQLVMFPRGTVTKETIKFMRGRGIAAVEVDDPSKVVVAETIKRIDADEVLICALEAMSGHDAQVYRPKFTENLLRILKAQKSTEAKQ